MFYLWGVGVREATSPGAPATAGHFTGPGVAPAAFQTAKSAVALPALPRTHDAAAVDR